MVHKIKQQTPDPNDVSYTCVAREKRGVEETLRKPTEIFADIKSRIKRALYVTEHTVDFLVARVPVWLSVVVV